MLHYLSVAVSAVLLIAVLAIATLAIVIPAFAGGTALTVLTQSMEPTLPPGTLIVIRPTPTSEIRIGDVLTYQIRSDQPELLSHRVISRTTDTAGMTSFITRGDNNSLADALPVQPVQVRGTLWYSLPWLGYVNTFVGGQGRTLLVPIVAAALFAYATYLVISSVLGRTGRKRTSRH